MYMELVAKMTRHRYAYGMIFYKRCFKNKRNLGIVSGQTPALIPNNNLCFTRLLSVMDGLL
jgi:hypothetical protein